MTKDAAVEQENGKFNIEQNMIRMNRKTHLQYKAVMIS
jgi:hypothetical protein